MSTLEIGIWGACGAAGSLVLLNLLPFSSALMQGKFKLKTRLVLWVLGGALLLSLIHI